MQYNEEKLRAIINDARREHLVLSDITERRLDLRRRNERLTAALGNEYMRYHEPAALRSLAGVKKLLALSDDEQRKFGLNRATLVELHGLLQEIERLQTDYEAQTSRWQAKKAVENRLVEAVIGWGFEDPRRFM